MVVLGITAIAFGVATWMIVTVWLIIGKEQPGK